MKNNQIEEQGNNLKSYLFLFIYKYKFFLFLITISAVIAGVFDVSVNYQIKKIIDVIIQNKNKYLKNIIVMFFVYKTIHHCVHFASKLLNIYYKPIIMEQTLSDIYTRTLAHSLHWFDSHLAGDISSKISDFQDGINNVISYLFSLLNLLSTIFISILFLFLLNKLSATVLTFFIIIHIFVVGILLKKQIKVSKKYFIAKQEVLGIINDSISNIFGMKTIGNVWREIKLKFIPSVCNLKQREKTFRKFNVYCLNSADSAMIIIMTSAQIYLLSHLYQKEIITAGSFAFIAMITLNIHNQFEKFLEIVLVSISPSIAQIKSSYNFINHPVDVKDKENAFILDTVKGEIAYKQVNFSYGNKNKLILHNFNLHIKPSEKLGIVGASGAGKTTLVKCLLRYFDIRSGSITIDGHEIAEITQDSLRQNISIIPQDITMFHRSIRENLQIAKYNATDEEITDACKRAKIHEDIVAMYDGYNSVVGERGTKLSGGQRQRIAIARALLKNAPILILDEATSSLDSTTEKLIQDSINHILKISPSTVIAIAHRLSTIKHMDRIIVLDSGKIIEEGTHQTLIHKKKGFYKELWKMQAI